MYLTSKFLDESIYCKIVFVKRNFNDFYFYLFVKQIPDFSFGVQSLGETKESAHIIRSRVGIVLAE